ncbi:MAG TPA: hypothetical protein VN428_03730 [Bryobacteraceae bacterium]|nr:hypothetical protein [Bryobacteraceae bacterium]
MWSEEMQQRAQARERNTSPRPQSMPDAVSASAATERHFTPEEIARMWALSPSTIRRLFRDELGVLVLQGPRRRGVREYAAIRIPQSCWSGCIGS